MTLKRRARHARFSSRGTDPNRRAGVRRRRHEVQIDWAPPQEAFDFQDACDEARAAVIRALEEAEAGNEGVDGLHPEKA